MWEVAQEPGFRRMIDNPAMKILHDDFELYVRQLTRLTAPPGSSGSK